MKTIKEVKHYEYQIRNSKKYTTKEFIKIYNHLWRNYKEFSFLYMLAYYMKKNSTPLDWTKFPQECWFSIWNGEDKYDLEIKKECSYYENQ